MRGIQIANYQNAVFIFTNMIMKSPLKEPKMKNKEKNQQLTKV